MPAYEEFREDSPDVKTQWGEGLWSREPDRVQFYASGLPCLALRGPFGAWNGYVGLPAEHPLYSKSYDEIGAWVYAHGGITYADDDSRMQADAFYHPDLNAISWNWLAAHSEGRDPGPRWWVGFDCAHHSDLQPGLAVLGYTHDVEGPLTYRSLEYVKVELQSLASQLAEWQGDEHGNSPE